MFDYACSYLKTMQRKYYILQRVYMSLPRLRLVFQVFIRKQVGDTDIGLCQIQNNSVFVYGLSHTKCGPDYIFEQIANQFNCTDVFNNFQLLHVIVACRALQ